MLRNDKQKQYTLLYAICIYVSISLLQSQLPSSQRGLPLSQRNTEPEESMIIEVKFHICRLTYRKKKTSWY